MVFSQSNVHTQNILKVVELNNLMPEKANGTTGISGGDTNPPQPLPWTTPSFSEGYLKPEPVYGNAMCNERDCEFFQDLVQWCSDTDRKMETTEFDAPNKSEESSHNTDTLHTTFSPQSWDVLDANSPAQAGLYTSTSHESLSPMDAFTSFENKFLYNSDHNQMQHQEQNLDILNLPVVIGNIASEEIVDLNPYSFTESVDYYNNTTQNTEYTKHLDTNKLFLHNDDEDFDMKLGSVIMGDVENNVVVYNKEERRDTIQRTRPGQLSLNMAPAPALWPGGAISTPEVLSYVEQLEKEKYIPIAKPTEVWSSPVTGFVTTDTCSKVPVASSADYESVSPKTESHVESDVDDSKSHTSRRKRHNSEDSDETYTPYNEQLTPTRKYKRRKPNIPIKDMIMALEDSQQLPRARRGRPPKRRESTVSSACSVDENVSCSSTHEMKYREIRDKNNEASKKSRMNRKLKELKMEQLAIELEERNKKLQVKADILEDMTKRLKDALMTAIMQKQK